MRNLLTDADRDRLVAPLTGPLAGEVVLGGRRHRALSEAPGSGLFPLSGNAMAAELLLLPGLREAHPALGDALLDFVMDMAEASPPSRRAMAGGLVLRREDPRDFELVTPRFRFTGDLSRGVIRQEPRTPGGPVVTHTGNLVEFGIGFRKTCADAEDGIDDFGIEQHADRVVLRHAARIEGEAGLLAKRRETAGRLELAYEVRADSPVLRLAVRFTAARRLSAVRLTTAFDALEEGGLSPAVARLREAGAWRDATAPAAPGALRWAAGAPLAHLALGREGWPEGAPVLHIRPRDPGRVMSVTAQTPTGGAVHWLLLRHGPADLAAGETLTVEEDRLLSTGEVEAAAAAMASGAGGLDLDPAPASGAALQAVGMALLCDTAGFWPARLAPERRAALSAFAARQAARVEAGTNPAELGHALVAADALRRAGEAGAPALQARLVARMAGLVAGRPAPGLGAHALALLGFARAAAWPDGQDAARALVQALDMVGTMGDRPGITLRGKRVDAGAHLAGIALLARAAGAVVLAAEAGAKLPASVPEQAVALHRGAIALLRPMVRAGGGGLVASPPGGAASPSVQSLVTLALLAPDRHAFGQHPAELQAA